jgi:hypothetical protein
VKTRRFRFLTILGCLLGLLLSNAALAGYVCPGSQKAVEIARMVEAQMPCADEMSRSMDDEQPGLCHAHCQGSQLTADTFQPPAIADRMQLGQVLTVRMSTDTVPLRQWAQPVLDRETGPPLAVRNCCFRF